MIINDPSFRSLTLIHEKVSTLLGANVFMPDLESSLNPTSNFQNVLATGLFYKRVFELNYWPENDFYFYCLSPSVKEVLVKMLNFDQETISVIPRYLLVPPSNLSIPFQLSNEFTIVFAGRLSPQKNIEFLVFINFYFQMLYSEKIKLLLLGSFDNEHHMNTLSINDKNYEEKILAIIASLPWPGEKPQIISGLNQKEWLNHIPPDSVYLTSSNLISEDFSMACAQIQHQLSIPLILPYWGAFRDINGENVRFYNSNLIATSNETLGSVAQKARNFVQLFIDEKIFLNPKNQNINLQMEACTKINRKYLQHKIDLNIEQWGQELTYVTQGNLSQFSKSKNGQTFFKNYINIFSN